MLGHIIVCQGICYVTDPSLTDELKLGKMLIKNNWMQ